LIRRGRSPFLISGIKMYNIVIIRYGEIFLKSEPVRRRFEERLLDDIRQRLKGINFRIKRKRHRIYVVTDEPEKVAEILTKIFGIVSVSPAVGISAQIDDIITNSVRLAKEVIKPGETFAVRTERTGKHGFSSKDIEERVGEEILNSIDAKVDLSNPDKTIFIEIRDDEAFVFDRKIKGAGGLPYRTQGKLIALISGGIDSPVASWMMMRRGCEIIALHFGKEEEVREILEKLEQYTGNELRLYCINLNPIQEKISRLAGKHTCLLCKRAMYRIAESIAGKEYAHGLCTGENLGQVASQTLENLEVLDNSVSLPVYRPVIGMDKEEIIALARKLGTYELASQKKCIFVPKKPATRADIEDIKRLEKRIPDLSDINFPD